MQHFTRLLVWQRSHRLACRIYATTESFPAQERYGLVSQLRRAAASVPTNLAEGSRRKSGSEFSRFINIAEGSAAETEYLLLLSRDLGYLPSSLSQSLSDEIDQICRMLNTLRCRVDGAPRSRADDERRPAR